MIIESYNDMKPAIKFSINHFKLTKDNYDLSTVAIIISCHVDVYGDIRISCGWLYKNELGNLRIFIVLNSDEIFNFTKDVYNEKIKEIMLLLKQYKIKQRKNELEKDFN